MISRWCAGDAQVWTFYNCCHDGFETPCEHEISPHVICASQRWPGHDEQCHRQCCWGEQEAESRDCTCACHPNPASHEVLPAYRSEQSEEREFKG